MVNLYNYLLSEFCNFLNFHLGTSLGGNAPLPNPGEDWNVVESVNFAWRGGEKRETTGVWIWSEPFIRKTSATNGKEVAILLMDTQGIFDNETTMTLTTQIFGLSTLISSFQVVYFS